MRTPPPLERSAVRMHWTRHSAHLLTHLRDNGWKLDQPLGSELVMPWRNKNGAVLLLYGKDGDTFVMPTSQRAADAIDALIRDGTIVRFTVDAGHMMEARAA